MHDYFFCCFCKFIIRYGSRKKQCSLAACMVWSKNEERTGEMCVGDDVVDWVERKRDDFYWFEWNNETKKLTHNGMEKEIIKLDSSSLFALI